MLDFIGWVAIFYTGWPPLPADAQKATLLALEVGYFWMLVVPWWVGMH